MKKLETAIIVFVLVFATFLYFATTFGVFETETIRHVESNLAKWEIDVNGSDLVLNDTFPLANMELDSGSNVVDDKIAPGGSGHFDIVFNPSGSEVSVRYDVTFDFSTIEGIDYTFSVVELNGRTLTLSDENTYTGIISLNDIQNNTTSTLRCTFLWNNNENNNDADSAIGLDETNELEIPVHVKATQYLGEIIPVYTPED